MKTQTIEDMTKQYCIEQINFAIAEQKRGDNLSAEKSLIMAYGALDFVLEKISNNSELGNWWNTEMFPITANIMQNKY